MAYHILRSKRHAVMKKMEIYVPVYRIWDCRKAIECLKIAVSDTQINEISGYACMH